MSYVTELFGENASGGQSRAKVDKSGRLAEITFAHQEVHADGIVIATHHDTDVDNATPLSILIEAPTGYDVHSDFYIIPTQPCRMRLYEIPSTDITDNGTPITHCRLNRKSTVGDTDIITTYLTPTYTDSGDLLLNLHTGGSTAATPSASAVGSVGHTGAEILMAPGKAYLWSITPDGDDAQICIRHEYYEVQV